MPERAPPEPWSPYGLEAYRVALLRRRNRLITLALVLGLAALAVVLVLSIRNGSEIVSHTSNGDIVTLQVPEQPRAKPLTLSISPGRTTVLQRSFVPEAKPRAPPQAPGGSVQGLDWAALLGTLSPPVGIAFAAARWARKRAAGPLEEVNLGVYKGALPLETITAQHRKFVFTKRQAHASLFGKTRDELLPAKPVVLARRR